MLKEHKSTLIFSVLMLILSVGFSANPTLAQNQFDLGDLEPGQLILNLNATEEVIVEQDTLTASLEYTVQGRDQRDLQNEVNSAMAEALAVLEATENIEFFTQQYQVYIAQTGRPTTTDIQNPVWRAQQRLSLKSLDSALVLELAGELQQLGLHIVGLNFSLSSEAYESIADSLMVAALEKLQNRANEAAAALDKSTANLVEVSLNGSNNSGGYQPRYRANANQLDEMATPVASPGDTQVSLSVSARALLSP